MSRLLLLSLLAGCVPSVIADEDRPNVVVIMSDDQGGGDYGFLGNKVIRTPHLDTMYATGGLLSRFYVSPVCAPTRASLMTGRYNYRTRCIDTFLGRAMMDADEITMAEFLRDAGYRTGIYGKWHMGDNYPLRAMDQGFQDSLVHRGGGIGQPSDPIGAEGKYTDPTLFRNGVETPMKGYCTDIYFDAAMEFISDAVKHRENFFTYIATNAPHGPFHDVPSELYEEYRKVDFSSILVRQQKPPQRKQQHDKLARIAAMITNIDDNVGRLMAKLKTLGIHDNTIVVYLNDNGPNTMRYVGNMRGMKTHVDDGGIRSPLLFQWPARVGAKKSSDSLCAHIDLLPTILDACDVDVPSHHQLDGRSFLPLLTGDNADWPTRQIVLQSHRGNEPQRYHNFALHEYPWKLVHPSDFGKEKFDGAPAFELYNLADDPFQKQDLARDAPNEVNRLKKAYDDWFADVSSTRTDNYAPPRIVIGTKHEPVTVLTRQDWRHTSGRPWGRDSHGFWLLEAPEAGRYDIEVILDAEHPAGNAVITAGTATASVTLPADQRRGHTATLNLPAGKFRLSVAVDYAGKVQGPHQVIVSPAGGDVPSAATPVEEHQWLARFVGHWDLTSTGFVGEGQSPVETRGTIQSEMLGGFWVTNIMKAEVTGFPFKGVQTIGYDPNRGKYVGTWFDSTSHFLWQYEGFVDESGRKLILETQGPDMMNSGQTRTYRDAYEFTDDKTLISTSTIQNEDGSWTTFMRGKATKTETAD